MAYMNPNTFLRQQPSLASDPMGGGFQFTPYAPGEISYGYSNTAAKAIGDTAGSIMQGTQASQRELQRGYERLFLTRALGDRAAFAENERRLDLDPAMSPGLSRLGSFSRESDLISRMAGHQAEAEFGYHHDLAELYKGTGTELAGLNLTQAQWIQQALLSKKQRKADEQAGWMQLAGGALGVAQSGFGKGGAWAPAG